MGSIRAGYRKCSGCGETLSLDYFKKNGAKGPRSKKCDVCRGVDQQAKPWTSTEISRHVTATQRALEKLWVRFIDDLTEDDRSILRELMCAVDRIPAPTKDLKWDCDDGEEG